jgi:hypothetical protein
MSSWRRIPYHACQVSRVCGVVNRFFPAILFKSLVELNSLGLSDKYFDVGFASRV